LLHDGAHARDVAAHLLELARVGELLGRKLHAQAELGAQQRFQLLLQLRGLLAAQFARFHRQPPSIRCTTMVRNGSLAEASAKASLARSCVTPSISKMILPGWISHTKYSGLPLPLPMRTSAGFCDTGLSGNPRIQMRPPRLMWRDMARRAASSWRAVRRPRVVAFRPYSPKDTLAPRVATPVLRPFCCLRYFVRAGWSMAYSVCIYSLAPSGFSIFLAFLTVVFGAGASAFFAAGLRSPSVRGFAGPPRFAPAFGNGFFARFGSAGTSGAGVAGAAAAPAAAAAWASPLGMI